MAIRRGQDKEGVAMEICNLLSNIGEWRPSINGFSFEALEDQEVDKLEERFSEEGLFSALSELNKDKAPRLDDLSWPFGNSVWIL